MQKNKIAKAFSLGEFDSILNYLSKHVVWHIIGEKNLIGIEAVMQHCHYIKQFFNTTEHHFKILNEFQSHNKYVVQGLAEFVSIDKTIKINACDIYTFDDKKMLMTIESYCIPIQ